MRRVEPAKNKMGLNQQKHLELKKRQERMADFFSPAAPKKEKAKAHVWPFTIYILRDIMIMIV